MAFKLETEEKKSFFITLAIFVILMLLMILLKYNEREDLVDLEGGGGGGGVTINFGDSDVGSGNDFRSEVLDVKEKVKQKPPVSAQQDEVLASDLDDAPTVVKTKPVVKKEPKKEEAKPAPVVPKPSKTATDALSNILSGNNKGGDGDDGQAGNKGKKTGSLSSGSYDGTGGSGGGSGGGTGTGTGTGVGPGSGSGSGGGSGSGRGTGVGSYTLAGRKALNRPEPAGCNEFGKVTVQITVDSTGKVIKAETGRGTNASPCLISQAKAAAMKWKFDPGTSDKQVGTIVYNFKVTD